MSTIKLNHVPLLESAINFPEWKRFITQVLQAEGYWTHIEGTDGPFDIFPKSLEPAACTATSKAEEKATFKEWWEVDMKARAIVLRRISPITHSHLDTAVGKTAHSIWESLHTLYKRTDILSQFDLCDRLSNAKLWDYQDIDHYLGEFTSGKRILIPILFIPPQIPPESAGIREFRRIPPESTGIPGIPPESIGIHRN